MSVKNQCEGIVLNELETEFVTIEHRRLFGPGGNHECDNLVESNQYLAPSMSSPRRDSLPSDHPIAAMTAMAAMAAIPQPLPDPNHGDSSSLDTVYQCRKTPHSIVP